MAASTVTEYLAALPADRRDALNEVRREINRALPPVYKEGFHFGLLSWTIAIAATLFSLASPAQAELPRHPLTGAPRTARGLVERILLFDKQLFLHNAGGLDGIIALQGGVLMPVSEDRDGIYYQAPNGVWVLNKNSSGFRPIPGILFPGGLFLSKTKPDDVYAYTGDARKQNQYLDRDWRPLSPEALAALKVGRVSKPTTKRRR